MRVYAGLEIGIAVTALLYFAVLGLFYLVYPYLYRSDLSKALMLGAKFALALLLIFPPAFFMGGTIPMIGQAVIRRRDEFGVRAARLYGVNTLGAALGAFSGGFFLVRLLGFQLTCLAAMLLTVTVAVIAFALARNEGSTFAREDDKDGAVPGNNEPGSRRISLAVLMTCFLSGFGVLALEVLWTRLLAQVHTNSIYSFSAVLVIVLGALALGGMASARLARMPISPMKTLSVLLLLGGVSVVICPHVFMSVTNGFQMLNTGVSFIAYTRGLFAKGALIIGVPAFFLGIVFPFLMKTEERRVTDPGRSLGFLSAINTVGAIVGSLLCGFVMLKHLGMWRTMQLMAALYLACGMLMPVGFRKFGIVVRSFAAIAMILLFTGLSPAEFRVTSRDPNRPPEVLLEQWETSDGTVTVVLNEVDGCLIKMNSNYRLGSTGAAWRQHFQGRIPLLLYPEARSVFFLGMGTGISVGGALDPRFKNVSRVVACDLVPEVVEAARKYMTGTVAAAGGQSVDYTSGLFEDDRAAIIVEDGRHYLMAGREQFDIINADLFLPYRSGAGSLYSREHFQNVRARLSPDGIFVQWLPMYQLTDTEFGTIARTMLEVFDNVSVWRNHFKPGQETLALVGHNGEAGLPAAPEAEGMDRGEDVAGLDPMTIDRLDLTYDEQTALIFYCGNLTASKDVFGKYPVNTDDKPIIEYSSPLSMRKRVDGYVPTLVGPRFLALVDGIMSRCPPQEDALLRNRTAEERRLVNAGAELHRFWVAKAMGDTRSAQNAWVRFTREWTNQ